MKNSLPVIATILLSIFHWSCLVPLGGSGGSGGKKIPVVKVHKSMDALNPDKSGIDLLETATIRIKVDGATVFEPNGVETAVVIVLDESGSMSNMASFSRNAAKNLIGLLNGSDKVALITFSDNAQLKVPLTTNHQQVITALGNLSGPDGFTNTKAAFDLANTTLMAEKTAIKKAVFLFTDGMPTPEKQKDDIYLARNLLNSNNINYFTVGFGNFSKSWLMVLANDSGGSFCEPTAPSDISGCFNTFWKEASQYVPAQQVVIHEVLSNDFIVKPGSLGYSISGGQGKEPEAFKKDMDAAAQSFYNTGILNTPAISELPDKRTFEVNFKVSPKNCKPIASKIGVNNIQKTYLSYRYGPQEIKITHPEFNQVLVPVNPCGVYVDKQFDMANKVVNIEVRNTFQDRNMNDVHIVELLGEHVAPMVGSPINYNKDGLNLGQVYWPHYTHSAWEPDGAEWRFFDAIPVTEKQSFPPLHYKVKSHGYFKPNTKISVELPLKVKPSAIGKSPVIINRERVVDNIEQSTVQEGASISFWYYYEPGLPTPNKEIVNGYKYQYFYENLPSGFSSKWGKKRHVLIYLPRLEVPSITP